jgi:hypothetical protein
MFSTANFCKLFDDQRHTIFCCGIVKEGCWVTSSHATTSWDVGCTMALATVSRSRTNNRKTTLLNHQPPWLSYRKRNRQHVSDFQDVRMMFHKVTPGLGLLKDRLIVQLQSCMLDVKDSEENASYATILRRVPPGQSQEAV